MILHDDIEQHILLIADAINICQTPEKEIIEYYLDQGLIYNEALLLLQSGKLLAQNRPIVNTKKKLFTRTLI